MRLSNGRTSMLIAAGALLLSGCSRAALDGGAILRPACAPNDAAAVQLIVPASSSEYPHLSITVWRSEVEGTTVTVPGSSGDAGNALWCTAAASCQDVPLATVVFGRKRPDASVDVVVDAHLPDGTRFRDSRRAQWQQSRMLCG